MFLSCLKIVDLESCSRRNNLRISGVPEGKAGRSATEFVCELNLYLHLPDLDELQIQWVHRILIPKLAATSSPRSIIVILEMTNNNFYSSMSKRLFERRLKSLASDFTLKTTMWLMSWRGAMHANPSKQH